MADFDEDLLKKIQKAIRRDKQGRYNISHRGKLEKVIKDLNDNILLTDFLIVCLINMDVNDIVEYFSGETPIVPEWKEGQKLKVTEAVKRSGLDGKKLVAAVRAVQTSQKKPDILNVVAVCFLNASPVNFNTLALDKILGKNANLALPLPGTM